MLTSIDMGNGTLKFKSALGATVFAHRACRSEYNRGPSAFPASIQRRLETRKKAKAGKLALNSSPATCVWKPCTLIRTWRTLFSLTCWLRLAVTSRISAPAPPKVMELTAGNSHWLEVALRVNGKLHLQRHRAPRWRPTPAPPGKPVQCWRFIYRHGWTAERQWLLPLPELIRWIPAARWKTSAYST